MTLFNSRWKVVSPSGSAARQTITPLPADVKFETLRANGVPAEWAIAPGARDDRGLVYVQGAVYTMGSLATHRALCARLSRLGRMRVLNVAYRLAPEHPHPAAIEDAVAAVRWVYAQGFAPSRVAIGGDSAGGNLSAAAAIALARDGSAPRIGAALLLYGVFDFATIRDGLDVDERLAEVGRGMVDLMVHSYLGAGAPPALLHDPRVSPLRAAGYGTTPRAVREWPADDLLDACNFLGVTG